MSSSFPGLRMLLLQVRESHMVALHEKQCVMERCELTSDQVINVNLVEEPCPDPMRLVEIDVIVIGGAGVHSAVEDYPFTQPLADLIRRIADERRPLFGSCWGHQFIARALGGRTIHDIERAEVGCGEITLTDEGRNDPVFYEPDRQAPFPNPFLALLGHQDRVETLPPDGVELARTDLCPNQAFRVGDLPIYGAQFHAELTPDRLIERLALYRHIYMPDDGEFQRLQSDLHPTPHAARMLRRFIEEYA